MALTLGSRHFELQGGWHEFQTPVGLDPYQNFPAEFFPPLLHNIIYIAFERRRR